MPTFPVLKSPNAAEFVKFYEFRKVEETADGKHLVWGIATLEQPDSDMEICEYESAVPVYQAWSSKALKRTSGNGQEASLGNIRVQHGSEVGGKVVKLDFKDSSKEIWLGSEPINDEMAKELLGGFYTGYSQGGSYAWRACNVCGDPMPMQQGANFCKNCKATVAVLYGLKRLSEVSYVDSPAIGIGFENVKANGSTEIMKFKKREAVVAKTKRVAGEDLEASAFAHVGDPDKTETWKLPIKFSSEEKTKRHIRNALARVDQTKGMSDDERAKAKEKIHAAATSHGIDVAEPSTKRDKMINVIKAMIDKKVGGAGLEKGLYAVGRMADMLETMYSLWQYSVYEREIEGDESEVPDELRELFDGMIDTFIAMATEEAKELAANKNTNKGETTMTPEELQKQQDAEKAAKKSLASHFAKAANHHEKMSDSHEASSEHHSNLAEMHKTAHAGMSKANANTDAEGEDKGSSVVDVAAEFHKSAGAEHGGLAKKHGAMAKMHKAMGEHCDKMAAACDEDEAKKVAKELKDADAVLAKAAKDAEPTLVVPAVDDFTARAVKKAQEYLLKDPEFQKEVQARQREILLGTLAKDGAAALAKETIVPTNVNGGAGGAPTLVKRPEGGDGKPEFAKEAADNTSSPGF